MEPSEPYMLKKRKKIQQKHTDTLTITPNQQFLLEHQTFRDEFDEPPVMETFYRRIRKKTGILMNDSKPV
jgi:deoxyribodipyrimidine photolyase-like uncharacterized protein